MAGKKLSRRRLIALIAAGIAAAVGVVLARAFWPLEPVPINYSKETTLIAGPLNADGTVNYTAYLNERLGAGVTAESNAAIPLLRALGPGLLRAENRRAVLESLGLGDLPGEGPYLAGLAEHARAHREELGDEAAAAWEKDAWDAGRALEYPLLADWLRENAVPLEILAEAARRPDLYLPLVSTSDPPFIIDAWAIDSKRIRIAVFTISLRARVRFAAGDAGGGREDSLTLIRLGRLMARLPGIFYYMLGVSAEMMAMNDAFEALKRGTIDPPETERLLGGLGGLPSRPELGESYFFERIQTLDAAMAMLRAAGDAVRPFEQLPRVDRAGMDLNIILRMVQEQFDRIDRVFGMSPLEVQIRESKEVIEELEKRCREAQPDGLENLVWILRGSEARRRKFSELAGLLLLAHTFPTIERHIQAERKIIARESLLKAALALAAYRAKVGGYPESLARLAPEYLPEVPGDPFSGGGLVYRREGGGYVLYSIGENLADDGGRGEEDADIVVRVD